MGKTSLLLPTKTISGCLMTGVAPSVTWTRNRLIRPNSGWVRPEHTQYEFHEGVAWHVASAFQECGEGFSTIRSAVNLNIRAI